MNRLNGGVRNDNLEMIFDMIFEIGRDDQLLLPDFTLTVHILVVTFDAQSATVCLLDLTGPKANPSAPVSCVWPLYLGLRCDAIV